MVVPGAVIGDQVIQRLLMILDLSQESRECQHPRFSNSLDSRLPAVHAQARIRVDDLEEAPARFPFEEGRAVGGHICNSGHVRTDLGKYRVASGVQSQSRGHVCQRRTVDDKTGQARHDEVRLQAKLVERKVRNGCPCFLKACVNMCNSFDRQQLRTHQIDAMLVQPSCR